MINQKDRIKLIKEFESILETRVTVLEKSQIVDDLIIALDNIN